MRQDPRDLIQRLLRDDPTGFDDIITWYSADVMRLCYALLWDREEARDVLQETLFRLIDTVKQKRLRSSNGSIKGFLLTTARNLCIDKLRRKVNFASIDDEEEAIQDILPHETNAPDRALDEQRFQTAFSSALARLTDAQRTVMVLHELNGESQAEIAANLHLSPDCVKTHLYRARRAMRILLQPFLSES
ncbi:MAG: RNA polymerase sigma factor [Candidatus Omnitrophota bacterium]|jgi:RNA polymerase sigma-70 factor (ECF subfamily)|nr:MAG: RNA polymerase sigma factor [Candidatus Omnitrophota bacterium]